MQYYQVFISAENKKQAGIILDALLEEKLITGGPILSGPAKFWWKGSINNMEEYCFVFAYTIESKKESLFNTVRKISVEEVPMITLTPFEANQELIDWIDATLL